jgi:hypothetical protein
MGFSHLRFFEGGCIHFLTQLFSKSDILDTWPIKILSNVLYAVYQSTINFVFVTSLRCGSFWYFVLGLSAAFFVYVVVVLILVARVLFVCLFYLFIYVFIYLFNYLIF